jgi:hypothetical protein
MKSIEYFRPYHSIRSRCIAMNKYKVASITIGISASIIILLSHLLLVDTSEAQHAYQCDVWLTKLADKAAVLDALLALRAKNIDSHFNLTNMQGLFLSELEKYENEC